MSLRSCRPSVIDRDISRMGVLHAKVGKDLFGILGLMKKNICRCSGEVYTKKLLLDITKVHHPEFGV